MLYCIAMAAGVILGAGCVCLGQMQKARDPSALPQDDTKKLTKDDTWVVPQNDTAGENKNTAEREKMQKQWENFMNYVGSEDGQVTIES